MRFLRYAGSLAIRVRQVLRQPQVICMHLNYQAQQRSIPNNGCVADGDGVSEGERNRIKISKFDDSALQVLSCVDQSAAQSGLYIVS